MKRRFGTVIAMVLCFILTVVSVYADDGKGQNPDYVTDYYMIVQSTQGGVDIYDEADTQSVKLNDSKIPNGTAIHVLGEKNGADKKKWAYTHYHGMNGYVPMDDLDPASREEAANEEYRTFGGKDVDFEVKVHGNDGNVSVYNGPGEKFDQLNAFLTTQVGGRPVKLDITREETFCNTRTRHSIEYDLTAGVDSEGHLLAKDMLAISNQGAYASHGHAIAANGLTAWRLQYACPNIKGEAYTVYTNTPVGGAMRGYGIPQVCFAIECFMDDIAKEIGMDPLEFRKKNLIKGYYEDAYLKPIAANTNGIFECLEKGADYIHWEEKRKEYTNQTGNIRRGVGMSLFSYKTGVWPISLEIAGARMTLNQDGSVGLMLGATEIGQGADTVFSQMAAEVLNMDISDIHIQTVQDTDVTPFDTGAYASRQSFVTGTVVKDCANLLKKKILDYAKELLPEETRKLRLDHGWIMAGKDPAISLGNLALESYYSLGNSSVITAEVSEQVKKNTIATGCCFAEVEVDIKLGKIKILHIINVHDSGKLINPKLAEMQVQGGMSMGIGYGLSEQLILDEKTGRPLNGTLLDYKLMTMMDTPDIKADFVELDDPIGPFGNKALGEPPAIPGAPAIRNAVLHATGVAFNENPLTPQRLIYGFIKAGLI